MKRRQATYTSATRITDMILMLARSWAPVPLENYYDLTSLLFNPPLEKGDTGGFI
jgi:hypothetical protein